MLSLLSCSSQAVRKQSVSRASELVILVRLATRLDGGKGGDQARQARGPQRH
jgi:hypothetical protein